MAIEAGRQRRIGVGGIVIGLVILAAVAFILVSFLSERAAAVVNVKAGSSFTCTVISVYDGDGPITCAEIDEKGKQVQVRLRGIDARETDNSCQYQDHCTAATGEEAKAELSRLASGQLKCVSFGPSYSRVDSSCRNAAGQDLSCEMIKRGKAARWPQYDPTGRLAACVPKAGRARQ